MIIRSYTRYQNRRKGAVAIEDIIIKAAIIGAILATVGGLGGRVSGMMNTIIGNIPQ